MQLKALQEAPGKLLEVQKRLREAGFIAWLAGGCVRDAILGREASDFDLVTDASVEQVRALFPKTLEVGAAFGVVLVIMDGEEFEVAQFRKESDYRDGRHPSLVEPATPEEDAQRRDLTVNALFYDPEAQIVYDFVGGLADLQSRKLRAVGQARTRFLEDHLRILRAIRFKAQLGFDWDADLEKAVRDEVGLLAKVSRERIREEVLKMTLAPHWSSIPEFLIEAGVNAVLLPGLRWSAGRHMSLSARQAETVFWEWGLWAVLCGNSVERTREEFASLKLSKNEAKSLQNFLFWFEDPPAWQNARLGLLAEKGFQPGSREGFQIWSSLHPGWKNESLLRNIWSRYPHAPAPWIRAEDLPGRQGPELGQALREFYHRQLEGLDTSREEALKRQN